jgi:hypothetical protein
MRRIVALGIGLTLLCALVWGALEVSRFLDPARLRAEVETLLAKASHGPVEIEELHLVWGFPVYLDGSGLRLWDGALTVQRARARLDVLSLLAGRPRLTRLRLDGADLRLSQAADGSWQPGVIRQGTPGPAAEALLAPFRTIEGTARFLLVRPFVADTLVVRNGRLSVTREGAKGSAPTSLQLDALRGLVHHSRLKGDSALQLRGRWVEGKRELAALEWQGRRERDGRVSLTLTAKALQLAALAPGLRGLVPGLALRGHLDGVAEFDSAEPGHARFALALTARELEARAGEPGDSAPLLAPRLSAQLRFALDPDRLAISDGRVEVGEWTLAVDAALARPLGPRSNTRALLALDELRLDPEVARGLTGWLPASVRPRARSIVERIREGRLVRGELSGEAPLQHWSDALAGRVDALLPALHVTARLDAVRVALAESSELEAVSGRIDWRAGALEVHEGHGRLDGQPLPRLDVRFQGLARLLESAEEQRLLHSSAQSLPGLTPLYAVLEPPSDQPGAPPPSISLDLQQIHHRALLWPLRDLHADVEPREDSLFLQVGSALWAGVPIRGEVELTLRPERHLRIDLEAPESAAPVEPVAAVPAGAAGDRPWAVGWLDIGPSQGGFPQRHTRARVRAIGADVRFDDVVCELDPRGRIVGSLELDLSREDAVPYSLAAELREGDLAALIAQRGFQGEFATGNLGLSGRLAGTLVPGRPLLHDASGPLILAAQDGTVRKNVPPVFALALASDAMNPFASREWIRYERVDAALEFASGKLSTEALELEGPDLRMFASGEIDMRSTPHPLDAEVALFLFRQLDWALVKIPILSDLLLGENRNLVAAYFRLVGTWEKPEASARPLRTLQETAGGDIIEGIPRVVTQGMRAIGALLRPTAEMPAGKATKPAPDAGAAPGPSTPPAGS